jgi:hypothetical protein
LYFGIRSVVGMLTTVKSGSARSSVSSSRSSSCFVAAASGAGCAGAFGSAGFWAAGA